jgi:predicted NAD-dependent protein-ADP-ribosyltransferase YbiA (DUF1768 family)
MKYISFTKVALPYGWLGNMSPYTITYKGEEWRTTEALFQALRFNDPEIQKAIRDEKSPMGAKLKAKGIMNRIKESGDLSKIAVTPLSSEDLKNMEMCIELKVSQHSDVLKDLLKTGDLPIYEDVTARGKRGTNLFWGALIENEEWIGNNHLGKIWEKVRASYNTI